MGARTHDESAARCDPRPRTRSFLGTVFEWEEFNPQRITPRLRSTEVAIQHQASFPSPPAYCLADYFCFFPRRLALGPLKTTSLATITRSTPRAIDAIREKSTQRTHTV